MFYQNHSPEVVRRGNGIEFKKNGFSRESKEETTLKVTLLGYKVMEQETKYTVYKILVKRAPDHSWVIFRRYTDFSQLHDKLREMFPLFTFSLPPKRWFKNFSAEFLEERKVALEDFLQSLVANKDVINSEAVRWFLCLDEPPAAIDGLDACCDTNYCLQRPSVEKKCEIETLRNFLVHKELQISRPERAMIGTRTAANGEFLRKQDCREGEHDDHRKPNKSSELPFMSHGACWYGSATEDVFTNIKKNMDLEDNSKNSMNE
ncbi:sorting nexin-16 [Misgurnus anguillicaudatus]|uniref:sorting nexin-16 n=1 Tax=Misgurnus anguillicaudatus TaxID=75329 RepID=UPI003CCF0F2E